MFYEKALGFKERMRLTDDGGRITHAEMEYHDGVLMFGPEDPANDSRAPRTLGGSPVGLYVYVPDVDAVFAAAQAADGDIRMPPTDMFWGDRCFRMLDPDGHSLMVGTHKGEPAKG